MALVRDIRILAVVVAVKLTCAPPTILAQPSECPPGTVFDHEERTRAGNVITITPVCLRLTSPPRSSAPAADLSELKDAVLTGKWSDSDEKLVNGSLRGLKDGELRRWIATKAELNRFKSDNFSSLTAYEGTLRFKDGFFQESPSRRENLLAFEGGKVFWNIMKGKRLRDGATVKSWFTTLSDGHTSVIWDMKAAKHGTDDLAGLGDFVDPASQFGYLFRAEALGLTRPAGGRSQQEWDSVVSDFRTRINPLLRGDQ